MDTISFLKTHFIQCSLSDLCDRNNFEKYDSFRKFIYDHYSLTHLENNNYIKYVKVNRQLLRIYEDVLYMKIINSINSICAYLFSHGVFPKIDIRRYLFKIDSFLKLIEFKKRCLLETINHVRCISENIPHKTKIFIGINALFYKYSILVKYTNNIQLLLKELMDLEMRYGIDQKLILLNNMERSFLGTKSEYIVNKVMKQYITELNRRNEKKYFYETNVTISKIFTSKIVMSCPMKGEFDGIIISMDTDSSEYIIEMLIETKSSLKATFEDIDKFTRFKAFLINLRDTGLFPEQILYKDFVFTIRSFSKIISEALSDWTVYICINNHRDNIIEKSHLYFSSVIKILDDKFIDDFYVKNKEDSIKTKYRIIDANHDLINTQFQNWSDKVCFGTEKCNIFYMSAK